MSIILNLYDKFKLIFKLKIISLNYNSFNKLCRAKSEKKKILRFN